MEAETVQVLTPAGLFAGIAAAVAKSSEGAAMRLAAVLDQAQPTSMMLKILTEEVQRAITKPKSVSHPELADPDTYWTKALWPQAADAVKACRSALADATAEVQAAMDGAADEIDRWLDEHLAMSPGRTRAELVDDIAAHCEALHRIVEQLRSLEPSTTELRRLQGEIDARRAKDAAADLKRHRGEWEKANGGDKAARQQWEQTYEQRLAARDAELRAEAPWRHLDLALEAHRLARATVAKDVHQMVDTLVEPILGIGETMVRSLDDRSIIG